MKTVNRLRIAMAASAALGLTALSSAASAQPTKEEYCQTVAWDICSMSPGGMPIVPSQECLSDEYDRCMASALAANTPPAADRRHEVLPA